MLRQFGYISVIILLSYSGLTAQSPWLPDKGGYFVQLSYNSIQNYTRLFHLNHDDIQTPRSATDNTIQLYGEYGLSNSFSIIASVPYKMLSSGDLNPDYTREITSIPNAATVNALGNTQLTIKYKLLQKKWVSAVQFKVELPSNRSLGDSSGLFPGYDAFAFSPLASIGRGWNRTYFYYYLSYIGRTNNFDDKLDTGVEGGWKAFKNFWVIGYFSLMASFHNGTQTPVPPEYQYGLYTPRQEYTAYGIKLIYEVAFKNELNLGIVAHAAGSTWGFMVAKAPLLSLGVYLKK